MAHVRSPLDAYLDANQNRQNMLSQASSSNNVAVVERLLADKRVDVNKADADGMTALIIASFRGHVGVVRILLAHEDVDVNRPMSGGFTPLCGASEKGHVGVVQLLLAHKDVDVNKPSDAGLSALCLAAHEGHIDVVRLLLRHPGVSVNQRTADGATAIFIASHVKPSGFNLVVRELLAHLAHAEVPRVASTAIASLPADLLKQLPGYASEAAALNLPLWLAAALGDTEDERAAADLLVTSSHGIRCFDMRIDAIAARDPRAFEAVKNAFASAPRPRLSPAATKEQADREVAVATATTATALRRAQASQYSALSAELTLEAASCFSRSPAPRDFCAALIPMLCGQQLNALQLQHAEAAARFALRNTGKAWRELGSTLAVAAALNELISERDRAERDLARDKLERERFEHAVGELISDVSTMSIPPQPGALAGAPAESDTTTASSRSSAGASGACKSLRCACLGCPNGAFDTCSACRSVVYCSKACQKLDWRAHKAVCKAKRR